MGAIDWLADKVQSFTGEKERRQLVASVKRQYNSYKKMVVENIESTNKLIVPFNQSIEILNDFRKNKFGNHIGILASFLGKFGRLKPVGQYTNERQQDLMVIPKRNFERKEEYISDADWTEDEVFEDTFFNTIFGQRSKTRKMNLSLHQNINALKLETEAVKKQFEIKRYSMQNNTQIIAIYLSCLKTISEQGNDLAQLNIGKLYFSGDGIIQNKVKAHEWFMKAAEQGSASAQYCLSAMYYSGDGKEQDYTKAAEWCLRAAEQEFAPAQYLLGQMYFLGNGVQQNRITAYDWYKKAANQGLAEAQYNLGLGYYYGDVFNQDKNKGLMLIHMAAEQGLDEAKGFLKELGYAD